MRGNVSLLYSARYFGFPLKGAMAVICELSELSDGVVQDVDVVTYDPGTQLASVSKEHESCFIRLTHECTLDNPIPFMTLPAPVRTTASPTKRETSPSAAEHAPPPPPCVPTPPHSSPSTVHVERHAVAHVSESESDSGCVSTKSERPKSETLRTCEEIVRAAAENLAIEMEKERMPKLGAVADFMQPLLVLPVDVPPRSSGTGWTQFAKTRKTGITAGAVDYYWMGPNKKRYRSVKELERYFYM